MTDDPMGAGPSLRFVGHSLVENTFKNVKSTSKIDLNGQHKGDGIDTTTVQIANSEIEELNVNIDGGSGTHKVMMHEVNNKFTKRTTKLALEGTNEVVVVRSNDGQDPSSSNEISMTGKGEVKLYVKDRGDASGEDLGNELKAAKPASRSDIEALESKLDQPLYRTKRVATNPALVGTGITPTGNIQVFDVTTTQDSGPSSLRATIDAANSWTGSGLAVITFSIATTDPGYVDVDSHLTGGDADPDAFLLSITSELPSSTRDSIVINGQS